ncbi:MAG: hypothetical protein KME27_07415 [Lyngbya sp. HA4199-MV5]|nr:hypothetical protein [Lyngbya sp. HA4199-MV5]
MVLSNQSNVVSLGEECGVRSQKSEVSFLAFSLLAFSLQPSAFPPILA